MFLAVREERRSEVITESRKVLTKYTHRARNARQKTSPHAVSYSRQALRKFHKVSNWLVNGVVSECGRKAIL